MTHGLTTCSRFLTLITELSTRGARVNTLAASRRSFSILFLSSLSDSHSPLEVEFLLLLLLEDVRGPLPLPELGDLAELVELVADVMSDETSEMLGDGLISIFESELLPELDIINCLKKF